MSSWWAAGSSAVRRRCTCWRPGCRGCACWSGTACSRPRLARAAASSGFLAPWTTVSPLHGATSPMLPVERYGLEFYAGLHEAGYDVDYRRNGLLWVCASEPAWEQNRGLSWTAADPDSVTLTGDRITELTGGAVHGDLVRAAQYLPSGAQVTTAKVAAAMADRITGLGGVIDTRRPVTGVRADGGRVTGVDTPTGPVECDSVVVAAGAWNAELLRPHGYFLPAVPQITSRIITEPIGLPETLPVLMLMGTLPDEPGGGTVLWVRWHDGGLLWGGMYTTYPRNVLVDRPVPGRLDELPTDGVLENQRVARAARYLPALSRRASIRVKHGAPCYTPDDMALLGAVPGFDGLYVMGGDNELGVTHGPGFGRALAEHIALGRTELVADLEPWRPDRFAGRFSTQSEVLVPVSASFEQLVVGESAA
ncbi:NAD(P)/FAD-dependent oxidoreductase [Amycolatopsis sp. M39]|uniref:NAD(P)/FAD-dependent oxidoreductase n=1 Tax=Amycolatopsis sp. M39 TaxID=1825094 RepID=UPI0035105BB8